MGQALMENRNGLIVGAVTTTASGYAEREAALALIEPHAMSPQPITLGADKGYDSADFVTQLQDKAVTRMSLRTPAAAAPRSMIASPVILAMRSRSASAKASRKLSAGPRRWPACVRCGIAGCSTSTGNSLSR
jgi:hypothetical protein